jgi:hypothetical protein
MDSNVDTWYTDTVTTQSWYYEADFKFIELYGCGGRDSSVGIATGYGLDGPRIESRWGRDFSHTSRPALGPTQSPVQWVPSLSRG